MSNPFERHGIRHLSASSLGLYRTEPAMWVMRYLYGVKDEVGASAWRGKAVEAAVDMILYKNCPDEDAVPVALRLFDLEAQGEISEKIDKERAAIPDMIAQASLLMRPMGMPTMRQEKIEYWLDGIEIPIIGYVDYLWPELIVDLKTTFRLPSAPSEDHAIQVTVYSEALKRPSKLVYVTPKKGAEYDVSGDSAALWSLRRSAFAVRSMLNRCESKNEAAAMFSPDFGDFRWNDTNKQSAYEIFGSM